MKLANRDSVKSLSRHKHDSKWNEMSRCRRRIGLLITKILLKLMEIKKKKTNSNKRNQQRKGVVTVDGTTTVVNFIRSEGA